MSLKRRGAGGKRDAAEPAITKALRQVGCEIFYLSGQGNPDVLAWFRGHPYVFEVKTAKGKRTKNQTMIPWPVVRTPAEGLAVLGIVLE